MRVVGQEPTEGKETNDMNTEGTKKTLRQVEIRGGYVSSIAAHSVLTGGDPLVLLLIEETLDTKNTKAERAEALCRLLGTYGLGTIVAGRLV